MRRYLLEIIGGGWLWYQELDKSRRPSASVDNDFPDQHNSSYHTEAEDNIIIVIVIVIVIIVIIIVIITEDNDIIVLSFIQNPVLQA